jgi:hypothetical protein
MKPIRRYLGTRPLHPFLLALFYLFACGFVCPESRPIEFGEQAPCTGILVPSLVLNEVRTTLETTEAYLFFCQEQLQLNLEEFDAKASAAEERLSSCNIEIQRLKQIAIDAADTGEPEVPWYESVPFVVTVTAAVSIGLAVGFYALADHMAGTK